MRRLLCTLVVVGTSVPAAAQSGQVATLALDEALLLAKQNNPGYQISISGRRRAETTLRSAYGTLLPSASTSVSTGYRQGKPEFFSGVAFGATSDVLSSSWGLTFSYSINTGSFAALRASKSNLSAAEDEVTGAEQSLRTTVTQQYILALQTLARAALQDSLVVSNQLQLELARAKAGVGSATSLDVKRAEVAVGQQQVAALKAHNAAAVAMLQLFQQIGVPMPATVRLTSTFPVSEPALDVTQLLDLAHEGNPTLRALQSREEAAGSVYRAEQSQYAPSLSLRASLGGNTQKYRDAEYLVDQSRVQTLSSQASCYSTDSLRRGAGMPGIAAKCDAIQFTDADRLRAENDVWPFRFTSSPYNLSMTLSLPLFDGFGREKRVQDAATLRSDARYSVRAQELKLTAEVTAAYTTLVADFRTVRQQETNIQMAREALTLAQERYRVGLNSLVDLQAARADFERAETDRIDAVYEYHRAYAALESAVGRALR